MTLCATRSSHADTIFSSVLFSTMLNTSEDTRATCSPSSSSSETTLWIYASVASPFSLPKKSFTSLKSFTSREANVNGRPDSILLASSWSKRTAVCPPVTGST